MTKQSCRGWQGQLWRSPVRLKHIKYRLTSEYRYRKCRINPCVKSALFLGQSNNSFQTNILSYWMWTILNVHLEISCNLVWYCLLLCILKHFVLYPLWGESLFIKMDNGQSLTKSQYVPSCRYAYTNHSCKNVFSNCFYHWLNSTNK